MPMCIRCKKTPIFKGRYYCHILKSIREIKNTIAYVLLNGKRQKLIRNNVDPFSSAVTVKENWANIFSGLDFDLPDILYEKIKKGLLEILSPVSFWAVNESLA